jgi:hypothetical protein
MATFPGVIIHEVAHQLFCRVGRVPVYEVRYFQFDLKVAGYVVHAPVQDFGTAFLISIGMHAFPSTVDARQIWSSAKAEVAGRNILAVLAFPFVILVFIANLLRVIWFDALYGFFIGVLVPGWILGAR